MDRWKCRVCGFENRVDPYAVLAGNSVFSCLACGTKHMVNASVSVHVGRVLTLDEAAREEEVLDDVRRFRVLQVSLDNGTTWLSKTVNVMDTNPKTSVLKEGNLVRVGNTTYVVRERDGSLAAIPVEAEEGAACRAS